MVVDSFIPVKTVVMVVKHTRPPSPCQMLFGEAMESDFSVRVGDGGNGYRRGGNTDGNDFHHGIADKLWLNGDNRSRKWDGFPYKPVVIICTKRDGRADVMRPQLSSLFMDRGFEGLMGEVLVFDRELTTVEVERMDHYLAEKWLVGVEKKETAIAAEELGAGGGGARGTRMLYNPHHIHQGAHGP